LQRDFHVNCIPDQLAVSASYFQIPDVFAHFATIHCPLVAARGSVDPRSLPPPCLPGHSLLSSLLVPPLLEQPFPSLSLSHFVWTSLDWILEWMWVSWRRKGVVSERAVADVGLFL